MEDNNITTKNNKAKRNKRKGLFVLTPFILTVIITIITSNYDANKYQKYDKKEYKIANTVHLKESGYINYHYSAYAIGEDGKSQLPLTCHITNMAFNKYSCEAPNKQLTITFRRGKGLLNGVTIMLKNGLSTNKIKKLTTYHDGKDYYYVPRK